MNKLKELRLNKNLLQKDIAKLLNVANSTYCYWEKGDTEPTHDMLIKLAEFYNVSTDYIIGRKTNSITKDNKKIKIPVLGSIPAGVPIEAIENIIDWEEITPEMANIGDLFALKVKGDSMLPRICEGDIVVVKQQNYADSGDTVVVYVNGYEATLKKIRVDDNGIYLIPNNHSYETKFYSKEEVETLPVKIHGKVIELRGKL